MSRQTSMQQLARESVSDKTLKRLYGRSCPLHIAWVNHTRDSVRNDGGDIDTDSLDTRMCELAVERTRKSRKYLYGWS